jgi:hypothetical protein
VRRRCSTSRGGSEKPANWPLAPLDLIAKTRHCGAGSL